MIRKAFGCFLLLAMAFSLLNGCALFNSNSAIGGACYYENKVRHNLPSKLSQTASSSVISAQKDKISKKAFSPVDFDGDIYLAGQGPGYWKNGVIINLEDADYTADIFVENGIVYVAGAYTDDNWEVHACYWKDGVRYELVGGNDTLAIFVRDEVVYVLGSYYITDDPFDLQYVYWVNGVEHLVDGTNARDIYVDENNDVYVAGEYDPAGLGYGTDERACYWKNDIRYPLNNYYASSIFVRDSIVYIAACDGHVQTGDIAVNGSDVYVAGSYIISLGEDPETGSETGSNAAGYWKNGELISLSNGIGYADHMFVSGDDVFITGYDSMQTNAMVLWINGQLIDMNTPDGIFSPVRIFVVPSSI